MLVFIMCGFFWLRGSTRGPGRGRRDAEEIRHLATFRGPKKDHARRTRKDSKSLGGTPSAFFEFVVIPAVQLKGVANMRFDIGLILRPYVVQRKAW